MSRSVFHPNSCVRIRRAIARAFVHGSGLSVPALGVLLGVLSGPSTPSNATAQSSRPSPTNEEQAVIAAAQALFDAMEALDPEAFRDSMLADGYLLAVGFERRQRTTRDEFADRLATQTQPMFERMWNPEVRIDGPVATLWAPYDFYRAMEFSHCGTDAFQLARTPEGWKVTMVSYTVQRPPDCTTHPEGPPVGPGR